ncbi:hypothetical protein HanIR_Chr05g0242621 [Helianthus annuus]|nr:hypothetical protein HanIR_Chr05g0242621 [Helianthus annuus]
MKDICNVVFNLHHGIRAVFLIIETLCSSSTIYPNKSNPKKNQKNENQNLPVQRLQKNSVFIFFLLSPPVTKPNPKQNLLTTVKIRCNHPVTTNTHSTADRHKI